MTKDEKIFRASQIKQLSTLLWKVQGLNKGSHFLENVEECIRIADDLLKSDMKTPRMSFPTFLESLIKEKS